ncbi:hypothetical protein ABK905_02315 [Acerihabitans sp. KWT182]|uniref:CYRIA/CYRIB Rac1 binding domain-containing protein n=1 Tax=Acerihabitans sp. KWT182 TaxID=3157919 RepID=A0AAU7QAP8_9GAMM
MDNVNRYYTECNLTLIQCHFENDNEIIFKKLNSISMRYFQLCKSDMAYYSYEIDELFSKIQNGDKIEDKNTQELDEVCEALSQKEDYALELLTSYQTLVEESPALKCFPWNGHTIDYATLCRNLKEEMVVKKVRAQVFDQLGELFTCALLPDVDKAAIYRASMRFLDALTLCLYSEKVFAARASVEALGDILGFNVADMPLLTDFCDGACLRMHLLPLLEKGYHVYFHNNDFLEADEISYLRILKGAFAEIAAVVEHYYGTLDYAQERGIHVPTPFFSIAI